MWWVCLVCWCCWSRCGVVVWLGWCGCCWGFWLFRFVIVGGCDLVGGCRFVWWVCRILLFCLGWDRWFGVCVCWGWIWDFWFRLGDVGLVVWVGIVVGRLEVGGCVFWIFVVFLVMISCLGWLMGWVCWFWGCGCRCCCCWDIVLVC